MDESFHHLLMLSHVTFQKKVYRNLTSTKLSTGQPKILDFLKTHNGCVQKEIAIGCQIEPATVTSLLLPMEEIGLIERRMENGNRRSLNVYLTKEGKNMQRKVEKVFEKLEAAAFQGFSEQEKEEFMRQFMMIHENIVKCDGEKVEEN